MGATSTNVRQLFEEQLTEWEQAGNNYKALEGVKTKTVEVGGCTYNVQFNPARITSSAAKVDPKSIRERKCFLCPANLPPQQRSVGYKRKYKLLVNPYPIFPRHLTIPATTHTDQRILFRIGNMLDLAEELSDYTLFYNGPECGASAPDHMHFQAGSKGFLPIESEWRERIGGRVGTYGKATLWFLNDAPRTTLVIESEDRDDAVGLFITLYGCMEATGRTDEPMMNVLAWYADGKWMVCIFPRRQHRPACYTAQGEANLLISPASVDLAGVFIAPRETDFEKITAEDIATILSEVCLLPDDFLRLRQRIAEAIEPRISVGILSEPQLTFVLRTPYVVGGQEVIGEQTATCVDGQVLWQGRLYKELLFEPAEGEQGEFDIHDVTIGINFHWERKEDQRFPGAFKIIVESGKLTGINIVAVEEYLTNVISSEMSATASLELLKAHAVISRSWLLARNRTSAASPAPTAAEHADELIRWYERSDHTHFDVCADDHCQRYQGITRASTSTVKQAIAATRGEVLYYNKEICDARFSKCCGGAFEEFQNCWAAVSYPYLTKQRDSKTDTLLPDLTIEAEAQQWIRTSPEAFCNTADGKILSQVLNNYDQETQHFYRWQVSYTQRELSELARRRSGIDFGEITDLIPVERGVSGRLVRLKIVGTKRTMIIGKELEIRRTLSESHLYSSAFVVDKQDDCFLLTGAGWGHGVGLCQIGAAVMGEKGYAYDEILLHYYVGANIEKLYE